MNRSIQLNAAPHVINCYSFHCARTRPIPTDMAHLPNSQHLTSIYLYCQIKFHIAPYNVSANVLQYALLVTLDCGGGKYFGVLKPNNYLIRCRHISFNECVMNMGVCNVGFRA